MGSGGWERDAVILEPCVALEQNGRRLYHGRGYDEDFLARVTSERAKLRPPPWLGLVCTCRHAARHPPPTRETMRPHMTTWAVPTGTCSGVGRERRPEAGSGRRPKLGALFVLVVELVFVFMLFKYFPYCT